MDKISKDDVHKMIQEWNKMSITQSVSTNQPTPVWNNYTNTPTYIYNFKQYDELDVIIFLYNRLVDEINDIKKSQKST